MGAANIIPFPGEGTLMNYYVRTLQTRLTATPASQIGDAVLSSDNPATKIQGMKALQAIHSNDALNQLLRLLSSDPSVLKDAGEYTALSQAVAYFGVDAKPQLLNIFGQLPPSDSKSSTLGGNDLYTRYFSLPVTALRGEISSQTVDLAARQAQLAQMDGLASTLQANLAEIQFTGTGAAFTTQDFILDTLMQMGMKNDVDLKNFGQLTAANPAYSDAIRGKAILLIARFGEKGDMGLLYPYLDGNDDFLKAKALEGITNLQLKEAGSTSPTAIP